MAGRSGAAGAALTTHTAVCRADRPCHRCTRPAASASQKSCSCLRFKCSMKSCEGTTELPTRRSQCIAGACKTVQQQTCTRAQTHAHQCMHARECNRDKGGYSGTHIDPALGLEVESHTLQVLSVVIQQLPEGAPRVGFRPYLYAAIHRPLHHAGGGCESRRQ